MQAGLTQARLARQSGIARRHLAQCEKGHNVSILVLAKITHQLHIPLRDIFEDDRPYTSVFISYGQPDEAVASRLYAELTANGVTCFFFPVTATPGEQLHRTMSDAIRTYDRVLLLCSMNSLSRPGVLNELQHLFAREAEEGGSAPRSRSMTPFFPMRSRL
jgi:transcriptional regulator with XRE-family HTH domain